MWLLSSKTLHNLKIPVYVLDMHMLGLHCTTAEVGVVYTLNCMGHVHCTTAEVGVVCTLNCMGHVHCTRVYGMCILLFTL